MSSRIGLFAGLLLAALGSAKANPQTIAAGLTTSVQANTPYAEYTIRDVPVRNGWRDFNTIVALNDKGTLLLAVGMIKTVATYAWKDGQCTLWNANGCSPHGLNNKDDIIAVQSIPGTKGTAEEVVVFHGGHRTIIPQSTTRFLEPIAITDDNAVTGEAILDYHFHAFLWKRNKLQVFPNILGSNGMYAYSFDKEGHVLASATFVDKHNPQKQFTRFYLREGSKWKQVPGVLPPAREQDLAPREVTVNSRGDILSVYFPRDGYTDHYSSTYFKPFGAPVRALGLAFDASTGYGLNPASAMNDFGVIAGAEWSKIYQQEVATLVAGSRVINLNTCIPTRSGWTLDEADAINDLGQIAGRGTYHGKPAIFFLNPVPPPKRN